jgi:hypothetical protein
LPGGLDLTLPDAFFDFADVLVLGLEGSARGAFFFDDLATWTRYSFPLEKQFARDAWNAPEKRPER